MSRPKKILIGAGLALALLVTLALVGVYRAGAWRLLFPSHQHDTTPPEIPTDFGRSASLRVLVFSKTNSFRHEDGIAGARRALDAIAARRGFALFHGENGALFDAERLARFDVVVFSNATGDMLSPAQQRAFEQWLEAGGGWLGIHSAGDLSHADWRWYVDTLIGARFIGHILGPQTQTARVVVEDAAHPATRGLPAEFEHEEEWYSWDRSPREAGFHVLLTVDETSYDPTMRFAGSATDLRMGDHPAAWWRCVGRGRALYATMGHGSRAYEDPAYARLLENALAWAGDPSACPTPGDTAPEAAAASEPAPASGAAAAALGGEGDAAHAGNLAGAPIR